MRVAKPRWASLGGGAGSFCLGFGCIGLALQVLRFFFSGCRLGLFGLGGVFVWRHAAGQCTAGH